MKTIGLLGGMSWESTVTYYQLVNEGIKQRLGGLHSAKLVLSNVDFYDIERFQSQNQWDIAGNYLASLANNLKVAGAEAIVLCTNTMHKVAHIIEEQCALPFLHIADATGFAIQTKSLHRVALLGTRYTMLEDFYPQRLTQSFGIETVIPKLSDIEKINHIIFAELCLGIISKDSQTFFIKVIEDLARQGCQGVILGCTEIGLLINENNVSLPVFDTTKIHANHAVSFMLS